MSGRRLARLSATLAILFCSISFGQTDRDAASGTGGPVDGLKDLTGVKLMIAASSWDANERPRPVGDFKDRIQKIVEQKLSQAGIALIAPGGDSYSLGTANLGVVIDKLDIAGSSQCGVLLETVLLRNIYLSPQSQRPFQACVWAFGPAIFTSPASAVNEKIIEQVNKHLDIFIADYRKANPLNADVNDANAVKPPTKKAKAAPLPAVPATKTVQYISSKSSKVFHLSTCNFVAQIKPENRTVYTSKEAALADGKRPCKTCKP